MYITSTSEKGGTYLVTMLDSSDGAEFEQPSKFSAFQLERTRSHVFRNIILPLHLHQNVPIRITTERRTEHHRRFRRLGNRYRSFSAPPHPIHPRPHHSLSEPSTEMVCLWRPRFRDHNVALVHSRALSHRRQLSETVSQEL